jgi:hypothetical protein
MEQAQRDRIVILGRPSSGKSVLLTVLYQQLWDSTGQLTIRACDGNTHAALLQDYASLLDGRWLPATQTLREYDLELHHDGRVTPMSVLDYPGELYRRLFFEKRVDGPELDTMYQALRRAMGVILLIDPGDLVKPGEAQVDTEYAAIEVVEHFRGNGAASKPLPMVLVYTKRDENAEMMKRAGGLARFTFKYMPRLARLVRDVPIVHLSAMRTTESNGRRMPWMTSSEEQVSLPLRLILRQIEAARQPPRAESAKAALKQGVRRYWWAAFVATTAVWLFIAFALLGVWVAQ